MDAKRKRRSGPLFPSTVTITATSRHRAKRRARKTKSKNTAIAIRTTTNRKLVLRSRKYDASDHIGIS